MDMISVYLTIILILLGQMFGELLRCVHVDNNVTLNCPFKRRNDQIQWTYMSINRYSILSTDEQINPNLDKDIKSRLSIVRNDSNGGFNIHIDTVTYLDGGHYTCITKINNTGLTNSITLRIIADNCSNLYGCTLVDRKHCDIKNIKTNDTYIETRSQISDDCTTLIYYISIPQGIVVVFLVSSIVTYFCIKRYKGHSVSNATIETTNDLNNDYESIHENTTELPGLNPSNNLELTPIMSVQELGESSGTSINVSLQQVDQGNPEFIDTDTDSSTSNRISEPYMNPYNILDFSQSDVSREHKYTCIGVSTSSPVYGGNMEAESYTQRSDALQ